MSHLGSPLLHKLGLTCSKEQNLVPALKELPAFQEDRYRYRQLRKIGPRSAEHRTMGHVVGALTQAWATGQGSGKISQGCND